MGSIADESSKPIVVCVFCGTSAGNGPEHIKAARALAHGMAKNNIKLVFGGGTSGLMGEVAKEIVRLSGPENVTGVIPQALMAFERKYTNDEDSAANGMEEQKKDDDEKFGKTIVVQDMHTRKKTMVDEVRAGGPGSGFVALSGGYGTMEELMEIVTWNQLGIHDKPVVLFNVDGYYDGLLQWVKKAVGTGFVAEGNATIMAEATTARDVLLRLADYENAEGRLQLDWEEQ
ncbi:Putative LOG family protein [Septoria linicola]|uniref:LOG family protein n=1 Tax=Septoria linicola TaxID=215465 RepID=A0A9Q9AUV2_9PEZI|nr:putative LOG family protein [Septoria linicola]USW55834.1 Putative LOG family protein [Septoria linicola]